MRVYAEKDGEETKEYLSQAFHLRTRQLTHVQNFLIAEIVMLKYSFHELFVFHLCFFALLGSQAVH